jgi:hypothetical protein
MIFEVIFKLCVFLSEGYKVLVLECFQITYLTDYFNKPQLLPVSN